MKKIFIVTMLLTIGLFFSGLNTVKASPIILRTGIGYGVNVVNSDFADASSIKIGAPIFDENWLETQYVNRLDYNSSYTDYYEGTTIQEINTGWSLDYGVSSSVSGVYQIYTGGVSYGFSNGIAVEHKDYASQFYHVSNTNVERYSLSLPYYTTNLSYYANNLDGTFLNKLQSLRYGLISYEEFFNIYGTHFIGKAVYGGSLEVYNSVVSNEKYFNSTTINELNADINAGVIGLGTASSNYNMTISTSSGVNTTNSIHSFSSYAKGGQPFGIVDSSSYSSAYSQWMASIDGNSVIINYGNDGLVPIWDLLPSSYSDVASNMENEFRIYANSYSSDQISEFEGSRFDGDFVVDFGTIRSYERRIDDDGRFTNHYDTVDLWGKEGVTFEALKSQGYTKVDIEFTISIQEVDDGYQYFWFYPTTSSSATYLTSTMLEHGAGYKNTSYKTYINRYYNVSLDDFVGGKCYIRYGASGRYNDDWDNKNIKVKLTFER